VGKVIARTALLHGQISILDCEKGTSTEVQLCIRYFSNGAKVITMKLFGN